MRQGKIALAVACACITTAPAAASMAPAGTAKLDPSTAGGGAHLLLDAQGAAGGGFHRQEIPGGLAISFNKGFAFDPAAVGGVCSDDRRPTTSARRTASSAPDCWTCSARASRSAPAASSSPRS